MYHCVGLIFGKGRVAGINGAIDVSVYWSDVRGENAMGARG